MERAKYKCGGKGRLVIESLECLGPIRVLDNSLLVRLYGVTILDPDDEVRLETTGADQIIC